MLANLGDTTTVKWVVADPDLATVETEAPAAGEKATAKLTHHALITTKKAGKTTIRATAGGQSFEIPLTITQYAVGARDTGNDLYQEDRSSGPGGEPSTKALGCIGCHGAKGTARHSPSEMAASTTRPSSRPSRRGNTRRQGPREQRQPQVRARREGEGGHHGPPPLARARRISLAGLRPSLREPPPDATCPA